MNTSALVDSLSHTSGRHPKEGNAPTSAARAELGKPATIGPAAGAEGVRGAASGA